MDQPTEPPVPAPESPANRTSLYLAVIAILISLVGTGVAVFESRLLREQQILMMEEKAASVWPYVRTSIKAEQTDSSYVIAANLMNKGVGPALVGSITTVLDGEIVNSGQLLDRLLEKHPGLTLGPSRLGLSGDFVLSPGEVREVYQFDFRTKNPNPAEMIQLLQSILLESCYCSIYNDCWRLAGEGKQPREEDCDARLELRQGRSGAD